MDYNEEGVTVIMNEQIKLVIETLNTTIGELKSTVSELNKTVQDVQLSNTEHDLLIKSLSTNVENINKRLERHSDKIVNLENKTDKSKANLVDKIGWLLVAAATSGLIAMVAKNFGVGV